MTGTLAERDLAPRLEIDLNAIAHNYRALSGLCPTAKVGGAVKANAYGLGAGPVSKCLYQNNCRDFFVATPQEGANLRADLPQSDATIWVLNGYRATMGTFFKTHQLTPVLNTMSDISAYRQVPTGQSALHVDTGMNRLGLAMNDVDQVLESKPETLDLSLVMSHLACSEDKNNSFNTTQLERFNSIRSRFADISASFANTGGISLGTPYHFDLTRPGIGLYGITACLQDNNTAQSVVTLKAPILQIRPLKSGETLGYGASFTAKSDMQIACVGAGYADGLPRSLSNKGRAFINGQVADIVGRVSMDLTLLDVTHIATVEPGQYAAFIGDDLTHIAQHDNTLPYEILTRLSPRAERVYL